MIDQIRRRWRLLDRPTGDILVLLIASTVCAVLLGTTVATFVYSFFNPGHSLEAPARLIADITNTLIGLLAGFLAGRTGVGNELPPLPPDDKVPSKKEPPLPSR